MLGKIYVPNKLCLLEKFAPYFTSFQSSLGQPKRLSKEPAIWFTCRANVCSASFYPSASWLDWISLKNIWYTYIFLQYRFEYS